MEQAAIRTFRRPRPRTRVGTPRGVCVGQSWPTPGAHGRMHESNGSAWMPCQRACGVLPRLLLNLLSTLRLAELGLEAHVPRSEACGAVVVSAFAVVLGELVRRCCANGRRTLWNRVLHIIGRWVGGASAHSSSTLAHLASSSTYAPTSRVGLVRPASSCAPRLARRVRRSTRSPPERMPCRGGEKLRGGHTFVVLARSDAH